MIEALEFVERGKLRGFNWYCGVPCSYLTPFINYVINEPSLNYVSSANEGDAVATAAGVTIGGYGGVAMMQNSGLGNAVSPLTSLAYVFRIPLLVICTHRGQPGVPDEPQHELMGQVTEQLFDTMRIPWEIFPQSGSEIDGTFDRACDYMKREKRPYALIMRKGTVAPHDLNPRTASPTSAAAGVTGPKWHELSDQLPTRQQALQRIVEHTESADNVVIATTGFTGRELYAACDRTNHFYMVGSMGCAPALGLGLALARPDLKVTVIDGDGASLMRMGNLATVGSYGGNNFTHILLDNEVHDSTGAQATVSANVDFASIASACGYRTVQRACRVEAIDDIFRLKTATGAKFLHLKIASGTIDNLPRPSVTPAEVLVRLQNLIGPAQ